MRLYNICERTDVGTCSLKLSTDVQRTADVGSKFHGTMCTDRRKIPYWFEFICKLCLCELLAAER